MNKNRFAQRLADKLDGQPASVTFTPEKRDSLRLQYDAAIDQDIDPFLFDGDEYVVGYAKYLLEYLDLVLGEAK